MGNNPGRSEFLDAATTIKRLRSLLEGKKKEIDGELSFFAGAEKALAVLGESDRVRAEIETRIAKAQDALAGLDAQVLAAEEASREAIAGFEAEVEAAKKKTEGLKSQAADKQKSFAAAIRALDAETAAAAKAASGRLDVLNAQIAEKEAALASLRETIASLAKL